MRRLAFPLAVLLLFPGPETLAQTLSLDPGTRVRVTGCGTRTGHRQGSFDGLRADTLLLRREAAVTPGPLSSLTGLDVSAGRSSRWKKGAVIGSIAGGVSGAALFALACWAVHEDIFGRCELEAGVRSGAVLGIGVAGGGLIGGAIGLFFKTEKWQGVPLHPPLLFVHPSHSRRSDFGVALRVRNW